MHDQGCNDVCRHVLTFVCIITSCITVVIGSMTELTPTSVDVKEGSNITLTCIHTGTNKGRASRWYRDNTLIGSVYYDTVSQCKTTVDASVVGHFTYSCLTNESYSLTLSNATVLLYNTSWMCYQAFTTSNTTIIRIKDKTNTPTIEPTESGTYKVIHNQQGNITCSVNGGNPAGNLYWNCSGTTKYYHIYNTTVSKRIVWTATQTEYCACTSTNIAGNTTSYVKIDVQYPVNVVNVEQDMNSALVLRENVSRNITCRTSYSRPRATIEWYVTDENGSPKWLNGSVSFYTLNKNNSDLDSTVSTVSVIFNKTYNGWSLVCKALNIPSHTPALGSVTLNITYPPSVNIPIDTEFVVNEGVQFNYTCPVVPGNPPTSNVTWNRSNSNQSWNSSKLLMLNVSRQVDDEYTCSANNGLENSWGKYETSLGSIRLTVHFQTDVTDFYIRGYRHNASVLVVEHTHLIFECRVQSNPVSAVRIYEKTAVVSSSTYASELLYNTTALCHDGPVSYSCHGNNSLNSKPSTRHAHLFVRCKPRVDKNADVEFNVTSAINQTATLSYTALAYPHPYFVWYRNYSSINTRASRITIFLIDLQTNLTITNVEESDFGEYSLIVTNDLGSKMETFHLKPDEHEAKIDDTTDHSPIIGAAVGSAAGLILIGVVIAGMVIYRRRFIKQRECSTIQPQIPATYENLKIDQIPNKPNEHRRETANHRTLETSVDSTYEGLSREDTGKENEYTCLGNQSGDDPKTTYENLKILF